MCSGGHEHWRHQCADHLNPRPLPSNERLVSLKSFKMKLVHNLADDLISSLQPLKSFKMKLVHNLADDFIFAHQPLKSFKMKLVHNLADDFISARQPLKSFKMKLVHNLADDFISARQREVLLTEEFQDEADSQPGR